MLRPPGRFEDVRHETLSSSRGCATSTSLRRRVAARAASSLSTSVSLSADTPRRASASDDRSSHVSAIVSLAAIAARPGSSRKKSGKSVDLYLLVSQYKYSSSTTVHLTPHSVPFSCWVLLSTVPVLVPLLSGSDLPEGKL